jgi:hypothetical protein
MTAQPLTAPSFKPSDIFARNISFLTEVAIIEDRIGGYPSRRFLYRGSKPI